MVAAKHIRPLLLGACLVSLGARADDCAFPNEGNTPLRRAVSRVQMVPETEDWQRARRDAGDLVQYRLLLDQPAHVRGKCHWTLEVLAEGKLWQRFFVSPDGKSVLAEGVNGAPLALPEWRKLRKP